MIFELRLEFGVRWQAKRDTALDGSVQFEGLQILVTDRKQMNQSAVAAALCRRTPKDRMSGETGPTGRR